MTICCSSHYIIVALAILPIHRLAQMSSLLEEHLEWYSVWDPEKMFLTSKSSYLLFSNLAH